VHCRKRCTFSTLFKAYKQKGSRYLHAKGCTLSVAENVNYLSVFADIKNPNFDPKLFIGVTITYWQMRFMRFFNWLIGA